MIYYFSEVAKDRETNGDLILGDMGQGLPFKAGAFDGAVSISALQWLCYANKASHNPIKRLYNFFSTLFACLSRSARAVLQFYPENTEQVELITAQATKAGFFGGVVVDFPNSTKAKKMFLVLMTGGAMPLPKALGTESEDRQTVANSKRFDFYIFVTHYFRYLVFCNLIYILNCMCFFYFFYLTIYEILIILSILHYREYIKKARDNKSLKKSREWIMEKKERRRRQGKQVRDDTKYTGRKRSGRF